MPVDAILVYGTRLYYSADGVSYTELTDMQAIGTPPSPDAPEVDVTPLADSSDYRQFALGLAVAGEMDCKQFYNKTRAAAIIALFRLNKYWKIIYPDNATPSLSSSTTFRGWLKQYMMPGAANPDDPAVIGFKIKLTGAPTFTAGS